MSKKFKDLLGEEARPKEHPDASDLAVWASFKKSVTPLKHLEKHQQPPFLKPFSRLSQPHHKQSSRAHSYDLPWEVLPSPLRENTLQESMAWENTAPSSGAHQPCGSRVQRRLRRRATPEATLDLHGMTQKEAFQALYRFLERAHLQGTKTVRVITGKGSRAKAKSPGSGVLRDLFPQWLESPPLSLWVSQWTQARPQDGGTGAWYVYLRHKLKSL